MRDGGRGLRYTSYNFLIVEEHTVNSYSRTLPNTQQTMLIFLLYDVFFRGDSIENYATE